MMTERGLYMKIHLPSPVEQAIGRLNAAGIPRLMPSVDAFGTA